MRILLVEPDSCAAQSIELMLKSEGFNVYTTDLGEEAVDLAKVYTYEAIILELTLPDMSGMDVLRQIRSAGVKAPVLICARTSGVEATVKALSLGADDHLQKPFHKDELVARLNALIRRAAGHTQQVVQIGRLIVNLDTKTASAAGVMIHLTGKEWQMLEVLVMSHGRTVSKGEFLDHIYGGMDEPDLKIVDVFVCKLRHKLLAAGAGHLIQTVWGRGYALKEDADPPRPMVRAAVRSNLNVHRAILGYLAQGRATIPEIALAVGVHDQTVRHRLRDMIADGHVVCSRPGGPRIGCALYDITNNGRALVGSEKAAA